MDEKILVMRTFVDDKTCDSTYFIIGNLSVDNIES